MFRRCGRLRGRRGLGGGLRDCWGNRNLVGLRERRGGFRRARLRLRRHEDFRLASLARDVFTNGLFGDHDVYGAVRAREFDVGFLLLKADADDTEPP